MITVLIIILFAPTVILSSIGLISKLFEKKVITKWSFYYQHSIIILVGEVLKHLNSNTCNIKMIGVWIN